MKLNATVFFRATTGYDNQNTFPAVGPSHRYDPEQSLVAHLRDPEYLEAFQPIDVEGLWNQQRFVLKMILPHYYHPARLADYSIVYGFTEPCTSLNEDTKIYFTRIVGLRRHEALVEKDVVQYLNKRYDLLLLPVNNNRPFGEFAKSGAFSAAPHTVLQRIAGEKAFRGMGQSFDRVPFNAIGANPGIKAVDITDIDVVRYADKIEAAFRQAVDGGLSAEEILSDDADFFHFMHDATQPVVFEMTRAFDEIREQTNFTRDGFITYDDLSKVLGDDAVFKVDYDALGGVTKGGQTVLGERIFNDHLKMLVATASDLGMERIVTEWYNDSGVTEEVVGMTELLMHGMVWNPPEEPEEFDPLKVLGEGGSMIADNRAPIAPVDSREFYGVNSFRVKIHLDLAGDIQGEVSINGAASEFFVKPAFSLAVGSGLLTTERGIQDVCSIVERYVEHRRGDLEYHNPPTRF